MKGAINSVALATVIFSHVKTSCFCAKAHLVFHWCLYNKDFYYMEKSVLLGTKPLVDSIRHFIRDPSGVFSVCHLCEFRIVQ